MRLKIPGQLFLVFTFIKNADNTDCHRYSAGCQTGTYSGMAKEKAAAVIASLSNLYWTAGTRNLR